MDYNVNQEYFADQKKFINSPLQIFLILISSTKSKMKFKCLSGEGLEGCSDWCLVYPKWYVSVE